MSSIESSYYPPRARWYSSVFYLADALRRRLHLEELRPPPGITWLVFLASLALPGYSFLTSGRKTWGQVTMGAYAITVLIFLIWLGYPFANLVFGLMISLHVSSIIFLLNHWLSELSLVRRLLSSLVILFIVSRLIYVPGLDLMEKHFAMPLRVRDRVVVANTMLGRQSVKRGDWVAYHFAGGSGHGVRIREGYGVDSVLAVPGDRVRFGSNNFEVNGKAFTRLAHMPSQGELVVPEKQWLVWPSLDTVTRNNIAEETIAGAVLGSALISQDQIVGKPFHRWFWRRQIKL